MKKALSYVALVRAHNCLMAAVSVWVGQYLTPAAAARPPDSAAMLTAFFICGFGNILNDILDIDTDRINHPHRPLPSGQIGLRAARLSAAVFLFLAGCAMIGLNNAGRIIGVVAVILLILYDFHLKHIAYLGNLTIAVLAGLTFILGGVRDGFGTATALPGPLIPAVFAFLMHFGREIIKDIQDVSGDRASGSHTAPVQYGPLIPLISVYAIYLLLTAATIAVYATGWFTALFFYINLFCLYLPLFLQFLWLGSHPTPDKCRTVSFLLRLEMLPGLAALVISKGY